MGVTALKCLKNASSGPVRVANVENPDTKGHDVEVAPNAELEIDMWIPWATSPAEFADHRLDLYRNDVVSYSIWQADRVDGDFVRFTTDGEWADPGKPVGGFAHVDGDRKLVVYDDRFELAARAVHGVTALVRVDNESKGDVTVFDAENSGSPGHGVVIAPGDSIQVDMWIPWAARADDFAGHHLRIELAETPRYWIWQAERSDGDFVRFSDDGAWHDPGARVPGLSDVTRERAMIVRDGSFEFVRARRRPGPPPTYPASGVDTITLSRQDATTFEFSNFEHHPGRPVRVRTVKNVARDVNGDIRIRLRVTHSDSAGGTIGPIDIAPEAGTAAFADLLLDGHWDAEAVSVYNYQLTNAVQLEVAWNLDPAALEYRVSCVAHDDADADRRISGIGGQLDDAVPWFLDIGDAIARISGGQKYYVEGAGENKIDVVVATTAAGVKYLKTASDGEVPNNLLQLPECY